MIFAVRPLNDVEAAMFNFGTLGIERQLWPDRRDWLFAVDDRNGTYFTTLKGQWSEMRDGRYQFLLLVEGKPFIFHLDGAPQLVLSRNSPVPVGTTKGLLERMANQGLAELDKHLATARRISTGHESDVRKM